jgi:hypothetical protein
MDFEHLLEEKPPCLYKRIVCKRKSGLRKAEWVHAREIKRIRQRQT